MHNDYTPNDNFLNAFFVYKIANACSTSSIHRPNRVGESVHPCLTPMVVLKIFELSRGIISKTFLKFMKKRYKPLLLKLHFSINTRRVTM